MTDATIAQLRQQQRHIPTRKEPRPVNRNDIEGIGTSAPGQDPAASGNSMNEEWLRNIITEQILLTVTPIIQGLKEDKEKEPSRDDNNDPKFPFPNDQFPKRPSVLSHTSTHQKRRKFPTWDGEKFTFNSFIHEVEDCIEIDRELMGSDRAVWYDINHSLPSIAKQKVSVFYASGWKINWDYRIFIDHLKRTFGNKKEKEDMQETLSHLKQKENQRFSDFFPLFDEALAGAGGENWPEDNKVVWLRRSLSEALKDQLFTVELDPDDYYGSVRKIEAVAYRFENSRHFQGKKGLNQSMEIPVSFRNSFSAPRLDHDGDVIMSPMSSNGQKGRNSQWKGQGGQQKMEEIKRREAKPPNPNSVRPS